MQRCVGRPRNSIWLVEPICLSPENKLMASFKAMWDDLDTSPEVEVFTISEDLPGKAEAIQFYLDLLSDKNRSGALPRDDYRYNSV